MTTTIKAALADDIDDDVIRGIQKNPMNPEFKARWLEALRSGHYAQDDSQLRTPDGYCCLGVACDVIDPTKWTSVPGIDEYSPRRYFWNTSNITLPAQTTEDTGLTSGTQTFLACLNDRGVSFADIADWIEENL